MIRLFLRLFLLILISFFVFSNLGFNPISYIRDHQSEKYITKSLKGVHFHLIDTLQPLSISQRKSWLEENNKHFNYRLKLGTATDEQLTAQQRILIKENNQTVFQLPTNKIKKLKAKEPAVRYGNLYMPFPDDEYVLKMRIYQTNAESYGDSASGALWLLQQKVAPYSDLETGLQSIQSLFEYPVKALREEELSFTETQWQRLNEEKLLVVNPATPAESFQEFNTYMIYGRYETPLHGKWIIQAGPISESEVNHNRLLLGVVGTAFVLFVPVLLWLLWFWFDLRKFQRTSQQYGSGQLDTRLKLSKGSALFLPGQSFNSMADELQKLIEGHKTLVNAVSHELKTPLARLKFALEILRDSTNDDEKSQSELLIQQNIAELESHIQELLLYARYERSITLVTLDRQAALKWLNEVVERFQKLYPDITLTLETNELNDLHIDPQAMRHLLNNLLSNAAEHSHSHVLLQLTSNKKRFTLIVEDDGKGVTTEWREKIFEPFSRPDSSRQRATGGSGLGLAIVKQIAHQHNGKVVCEEGIVLKGARFKVEKV